MWEVREGVRVYLNAETWVGTPGQELAEQVRKARAEHAAIVMIHENDAASGGCEFGHFFSTTPRDLIQGGLYKALALAFYPQPFRHTSSCLIARALGAVEPITSRSMLREGRARLARVGTNKKIKRGSAAEAVSITKVVTTE